MEHLCQVPHLFRRHHGKYATILIAPSVHNSNLIWNSLAWDNRRRARHIESEGTDPGGLNDDWFEVSIDFRCYMST